MTAKEAYQILIKNKKGFEGIVAFDMGNFYLIPLVPKGTRETYYTGRIFDAVDKNTGRIFEYDITKDVDKYLNAKKISLKGSDKVK